MTKTIVKRLTAFVLALVMCAMAFMAAGGANVKAETQLVGLDGMVYPSGTIEKDVFHFTSDCKINFIAGNENLVPSRQELMNSFSADALYSYCYTYHPEIETTFIDKDTNYIYILNDRLQKFSSASGDATFKASVFAIKVLPRRDMNEAMYFGKISANDNVPYNIFRLENFGGLSFFTSETGAQLYNEKLKVIITFYSPACYFEVTDTWTVPYSNWSAEAAEAGQSIEEYFK